MATFTIADAQFLGCSLVLGEERHLLEKEPLLYQNDPVRLKRLQQTLGMDVRLTAKPGTTVCDMAELAAYNLLDALDVGRHDLGAVIFVTQTPDYTMPGNAHVLHGRMKLPPTCMALDVTAGCSGFVYGLNLAALLASRGVTDVLLLCGDSLSKVTNRRDSTLLPMFGDAASAALLRHTPGAGPMTFVLGSDGGGVPLMFRPAGGQRTPSTAETRKDNPVEDGVFRSEEDLFMNGYGIFNFTLTTQPDVLRAILAASNATIDDIDYFIFHQANKYIVETLRKKMGIPQEKAPSELFSRYGNLNAASIPGVLCAFLRDDLRLRERAASAILQGFGIGLSWGACHLQFDHPICLPPIQFSSHAVADRRERLGVA